MRWVLIGISCVAAVLFIGAVLVTGFTLTSSEKKTERCISVFDNQGESPSVEWFPPRLTCTSSTGESEVAFDPSPLLSGLAVATIAPLLLARAIHREETGLQER